MALPEELSCAMLDRSPSRPSSSSPSPHPPALPGGAASPCRGPQRGQGPCDPHVDNVAPGGGVGPAGSSPVQPAPARWEGWVHTSLPDGLQEVVAHARYEKDEENGWIYGHHQGCTPAQHEQLVAMVLSNRKCFAFSMAEVSEYSGHQGAFEIPLLHSRPIISQPRRLSPLEKRIQDEKCGELRDAGIIVPSTSVKYASLPTMPVKKDETGVYNSVRFALNLIRVNKATVPDTYRLPRPDDMWLAVGTDSFLSVLDLRAAFFSVPVKPEDTDVTSFWWLSNTTSSLWKMVRMPAGSNRSANFLAKLTQTEIALAGLSHCAMAYLDDILIHSHSADQHIRDIDAVLKMLFSVGLKVHPSKSTFMSSCVGFLGHNVSQYGLTPTEAKVLAITAQRAPENVSELRAVLGFIGYYRCYVPDYSALAAPMNSLLCKGVEWMWGPEQQASLDALKSELCTEGRALKRLDPAKPVKVYTDFSAQGIACVGAQVDEDGHEYMWAACSRSLNKAEKNYGSYKGEMLAVVWACKILRPFIHGLTFTIITDHKPLLWLMQSDSLTGQYARWALSLQEFAFTLEHRPGKQNINADVLSRLPLSSIADVTGARLDDDADYVPSGCRPAVLTSSCSYKLREEEIDNSPSPRPTSTIFRAAQALCSFEALHYLQGLCAASALEDFFPDTDDLLAGHAGYITDTVDLVTHKSFNAAQLQLRQLASTWLLKADMSNCSPWPKATVRACCQNPAFLHHQPLSLGHTVAWHLEGVGLYEPFGGLCAGLEMLLRNGITVQKYLYSDTNVAARAVALHRVAQLCALYPMQLQHEAVADMFALPQDVTAITSTDLSNHIGSNQHWPWLLVAGWECQDLSPAGSGRGLAGPKSSTYFSLIAVLWHLQHMLPPDRFAYLLENTAMQYGRHAAPLQDFQLICTQLGDPLCLDAAQFGSYAHRLRNFWTNIAPLDHIKPVLQEVKRNNARVVDDILLPLCQARVCAAQESPPYHQCNVVGEPLRALPTLMATIGSYAFRAGGSEAGRIWDPTLSLEREPLPVEREAALGYTPGCTAAPGVSGDQRHHMTGGCMDAFCMQALLAVLLLVNEAPPVHLVSSHPPVGGISLVSHACPGLGYVATATPSKPTVWLPSSTGPELALQHTEVVPALSSPFRSLALLATNQAASNPYLGNHLLCALIATQDQLAAAADEIDRNIDIWEDAHTLHYLQYGKHRDTASASDKRRAQRRAQQYTFRNGNVRRVMPDGTTRIVPQPHLREQIVQDTHDQAGHFGRRRTQHLVLCSYWWADVYSLVRAVVGNCKVCDRVRVSFNARQPELCPLVIEGMFYRWGVDLCGPFPATKRGHKYIMIAIEHFSKHLELIPLPNKTAPITAAAFRQHVLGRFGACAEVVTDQGAEFTAEFQDLCVASLVDHRRTSPNHPQADGLAERAVQTTKRALRKHVELTQRTDDWDDKLPWIMLGYNGSKQASTGYSPFFLLYGTMPVIPPAVKHRMDEPLDFDHPEEASESLLLRAADMQRHGLLAGEALKIAQHRDMLRYALLRGGAYRPQLRRFTIGDYVYLRGTPSNTLGVQANADILRVLHVGTHGVITLYGSCGTPYKTRIEHCAPCHLPDIDGTIRPHTAIPAAETPCQGCNHADRPEDMLICDSCAKGWHIGCLSPPLTELADHWQCPDCIRNKTPLPAIEEARQSDSDRLKQLRNENLIGRFILKRFVQGPQDKEVFFWGIVAYLGPASGRKCFTITFTDDEKETMSYSELMRWIQPANTALPKGVRFESKTLPLGKALLTCYPLRPADSLHGCAALASDLSSMVQRSMPGAPLLPWPSSWTAWGPLEHPYHLPTLCDEVHLCNGGRCHDPWYPAAQLPSPFAAALDALDVRVYDNLAPLDCIVTAPPTHLLDAAILLGAPTHHALSCFSVPAIYVTHAHNGRLSWLQQWQGRNLLSILSQPNLEDRDRHIWLLLFHSQACRRHLSASDTREDALWLLR